MSGRSVLSRIVAGPLAGAGDLASTREAGPSLAPPGDTPVARGAMEFVDLAQDRSTSTRAPRSGRAAMSEEVHSLAERATEPTWTQPPAPALHERQPAPALAMLPRSKAPPERASLPERANSSIKPGLAREAESRWGSPPLVIRPRIEDEGEDRKGQRAPLEVAPLPEVRDHKAFHHHAMAPLTPSPEPESAPPPAPARLRQVAQSTERVVEDKATPRVSATQAPKPAAEVRAPAASPAQPSSPSPRATERAADRVAPQITLGRPGEAHRHEASSPRRPVETPSHARGGEGMRAPLQSEGERLRERQRPSASPPDEIPRERPRPLIAPSPRVAQASAAPPEGRGDAKALAKSAHPGGAARPVGQSPSPERSSPAKGSRAGQAGRPSVSISIGKLEIRNPSGGAARAPTVISPRAHAIDPGLSFGGFAPGRW